MSGIGKRAMWCLIARGGTSVLRPVAAASNVGHSRLIKSSPTTQFTTRNLHTKGLLRNNSNTTHAQLATTQGEKELAEFLVDEIGAEKKLQKAKNIPVELDGFAVKLNGSQVTLKKIAGEESIEIVFNINHSVDSDHDGETEQSIGDKPAETDGGAAEMKSRPSFDVVLKRGSKCLSFTCSMVAPTASNPSESGYTDLFTIDEVSLYEGEWNDDKYAVSGEVLDGTLYDLFMNLLEDKGISNEFVEKMSDFSTVYEHSCYINFLENLQKFAQGK